MNSHYNFVGEPAYCLDYLEGTEVMVTGGGDDHAFLVDARQLDVLADLGSAADSIISVRFCNSASASNETALLATASMDGIVRVYASHPEQGIIQIESLDCGVPESEVTWIDWHPRGSVLLAGFSEGFVWMWNVDAGKSKVSVMAVFNAGAAVTSGRFMPDGKGVLVGSKEGSLFFLSPKDGLALQSRYTPATHHTQPLGEVTTLAPHPTAPLVMVGDADGHVKVFKLPFVAEQPPLHELSGGHVEGLSIESVAFHPAGQFALSAGMDSRVLFYDVRFALRSQFSFPAIEGAAGEGITLCKWIAGLPNGLQLPSDLTFAVLVGSSIGRVAVVDGRTGAVLRRLKGRLGVPVLDGNMSAGGIVSICFDDGVISQHQL